MRKYLLFVDMTPHVGIIKCNEKLMQWNMGSSNDCFRLIAELLPKFNAHETVLGGFNQSFVARYRELLLEK